MDKLKRFFTSVKEISFFERIFRWAKIRILSFDAFSEFEALERKIINQEEKIQDLDKLVELINKEKEGLEKINRDIGHKFGSKNNFNQKIDELNQETEILIDEIEKWQT